MDEPITDPRARDEIPAYVVGGEAWRLRREMQSAADVLEPMARTHPDAELRRALDVLARLCRRGVNLGNAAGPHRGAAPWWRRLARWIVG